MTIQMSGKVVRVAVISCSFLLIACGLLLYVHYNPVDVCDITAFGAAISHTSNTRIIQGLIDNSNCQTVLVPEGSYRTGSLRFVGLQNKKFILHDDAILEFTVPYDDQHNATIIEPFYPISYETGIGKAHQSLLYIENSTNIVISGGLVKGNGPIWWRWYNLPPGYDLRNSSCPDYLHDVARPSTIRIRNSTFVDINNLRIEESPTWTLMVLNSSDVHLDRLQLHVNVSEYCFSNRSLNESEKCYQAANTDGIDIANSRNVVVENSLIYSHDDAIMIGAAQGWSTQVNEGDDLCGIPPNDFSVASDVDSHDEVFYTENVTVRNVSLLSVQGAITFDTCWNGRHGIVRDVNIEDVTVGELDNSLRTVGDCRMRKYPYDSAYDCPYPVTGQVIHFRSQNPSKGRFENISIRDVQVGHAHQLMFFSSSYEPPPTLPIADNETCLSPVWQDITISNVQVKGEIKSAIFKYYRTAGSVFNNISIDNVLIGTDDSAAGLLECSRLVDEPSEVGIKFSRISKQMVDGELISMHPACHGINSTSAGVVFDGPSMTVGKNVLKTHWKIDGQPATAVSYVSQGESSMSIFGKFHNVPNTESFCGNSDVKHNDVLSLQGRAEVVENGASIPMIKMSGTLSQKCKAARGLTLQFGIDLPKGESLFWHDDFDASTKVQSEGSYRGFQNDETNNIHDLRTNSMDMYPFGGVVSFSDFGMALTRILPTFDSSSQVLVTRSLVVDKVLWIEIDVSFSQIGDDSFSYDVPFEFAVFFPTTFRKAVDQFWQVFSNHYHTEVSLDGKPWLVGGTWLLGGKTIPIPNPEDFYFRFQEGVNDAEDSQKMNTQGTGIYPYTEAHLMHWPRDPETFTCEANTTEKYGLMCGCILDSAALLRDGTYCSTPERTPWNVHGRLFRSDLSIGNEENGGRPSCRDIVMDHYQTDFDRAGRQNFTIEGMYLDSVEFKIMDLNYRNSSQHTSVPVPDVDNFPTRLVLHGMVDYVRVLRDRYPTKIIFANAMYWATSHLAHLIDVAGGEHGWMTSTGEYQPDPIQVLRFKRAMSHRRPYLVLMNVDWKMWTGAETILYFMEATSFGFWPSFFSGDYFDHLYFDDPTCYERDRPTFRTFMPILRILNSKGWGACNGIHSYTLKFTHEHDDAASTFHIEKFGDDMLTVHMRFQNTTTPVVYSPLLFLELDDFEAVCTCQDTSVLFCCHAHVYYHPRSGSDLELADGEIGISQDGKMQLPQLEAGEVLILQIKQDDRKSFISGREILY